MTTTANNPWLQEFPDPLTRTTWDNYLTVSEADAKELGLHLKASNFFKESSHDATGGLNGTYANVTVNGATVKAPVIVQPGQARGTVGLSFGYGRSAGLKEEMQTGVNAYPLYEILTQHNLFQLKQWAVSTNLLVCNCTIH